MSPQSTSGQSQTAERSRISETRQRLSWCLVILPTRPDAILLSDRTNGRTLSRRRLPGAMGLTVLGQATDSSAQLGTRTSSWPHRDRK